MGTPAGLERRRLARRAGQGALVGAVEAVVLIGGWFLLWMEADATPEDQDEFAESISTLLFLGPALVVATVAAGFWAARALGLPEARAFVLTANLVCLLFVTVPFPALLRAALAVAAFAVTAVGFAAREQTAPVPGDAPE